MLGALVYAASSDDNVQGNGHDSVVPASSRRPVRLAASTHNTATDAELVERLQHDDKRALEELARRYLPRLGTIAYAILGSDDSAQDVVQDTLIALWDQRVRLDPRANVVGYLSRMTRNRALDVLRHQHAESRAVQRFSIATDAPLQTAHNAAEAQLGEADEKARVYAALRQVPPGPRETFLLSWEHGLTYAEIAKTLGTTVTNVRQQMRRATQRLARCLLEKEGG